MLFFPLECRRSSNPEVLHSMYIFLRGNDCFLICHSSLPQRSKVDFQVRHFSFGSIRSHWKGGFENQSKKIYVCDSCVNESLNMYEIERCLNPSSPPHPKWALGAALQVKSHFVKEMCRVFLFQATYSLRLNTRLYVEKLGHILLGFAKLKVGKRRLCKRPWKRHCEAVSPRAA